MTYVESVRRTDDMPALPGESEFDSESCPWTIICFSTVDWSAHRQRPQWLMSLMAERGASVVFVDNLGQRLPRLRDARRVAKRARAWLSTTAAHHRIEGPGLVTDAPVVLPLQHMKPLRAIARRTLARRLIQRIPPQRPLIVWTYLALPAIIEVAGRLSADLLVYDWCDDASAHVLSPSKRHLRRLGQWETEMARQADLVFVASAELLRERDPENPRTYLAPHGSPPLLASASVPAGISALPHPRVGFAGSISEWTDLDLIEGLARARPQWSFVLMGPVRGVKVKRLKAIPNITVTGELPYESVSAVLDEVDAAIIPYRITPATRMASPVKLHEYLAHGLPVVSVDVPEVRAHAPDVQLATGVDEFVAALETGFKRGRRAPAIGPVPWTGRVDEMVARVKKTLAEQG